MLDRVLMAWFILTGLSTAYVAWDAVTRNPEMRVMKWGWVLVTLYTGVIGAAIYVLSCQEPADGMHERFVAPLWKQALGSTIHCLAGDATGIIVAAAVTMAVGLPMGIDLVAEYVFGFAFGLLIFQALFMRDMLGGSYALAVRRSFVPEWYSMNAVMAGMIPVMTVLMTRHMTAMEPRSLQFWGVMSLATLVGAVVAYPVNVWLVAAGLKHGMGTVRALGRGGAGSDSERTLPTDLHQRPAMPNMPGMTTHAAHAVPAGLDGAARAESSVNWPRTTRAQLTAVGLLTVVALGAGVLVAALFGDLAMRGRMPAHGPTPPMVMPMGPHDPVRDAPDEQQRAMTTQDGVRGAWT